jgi:C1A family cysteine protease
MLSESDSDSSATCGHVTPDRIMTMVKHNISPANPGFSVKRTLSIELKNPNVVVGPEGRQGWWTAIYDEGFDINLDGWNVRCAPFSLIHRLPSSALSSTRALYHPCCCILQYFTFFRYTPKHKGANPTKAEQFNWHCNETVSGWYHLQSSPRGPGSHSWGCFVARQVQRAVPLDSEEYSEDAVAAREGMVSGEMVLSATVMTGNSADKARFAQLEASIESQVAAEVERLGMEKQEGMETTRRRVTEQELANAEAEEGGRRTVEEALAQLLGGSTSSSVADDVAASAPSSFLEVASLASSSVSSDEAIRSLASRESAQTIADRLNADHVDNGGTRLWRAQVPEHLLGISHDEARKRVGATSKDFRASTRAARRHHHRLQHHRASLTVDADEAEEEVVSHGHVRANRRLASKHHQHHSSHSKHLVSKKKKTSKAKGHKGHSQHKVPDLSAQFGKHSGTPVDISSYPKCLDWSTVEDGRYIPDVLDQGHCGSCYAASATDAITARARIKTKGKLDHRFSLSVQSVVQCSGHNQGCDGGYPYLVGKFGHEIGFVTSECMRYTARHDVCPAKVECSGSGETEKYKAIWHGMTGTVTTQGGGGAKVDVPVEQHSNDEVVADTVSGRSLLEIAGRSKASSSASLRGSSGEDDAVSAGPLSFSLPKFRQSDAAFDSEAAVAAEAGTAVADSAELALEANGDLEGTRANTYALSQDRLYVSRYGYVGGFYGAGSESAMIKELQDGPLVVALNAPGDLFYYHSGIYHHDERPENGVGNGEYDVTPISRFEKTNHAVLLVGYCEEDVGNTGKKVKYWKLKNSWSRGWGELRDKNKPKDSKGRRDGGYFRMVRGTDTLAVESMAVVIDP